MKCNQFLIVIHIKHSLIQHIYILKNYLIITNSPTDTYTCICNTVGQKNVHSINRITYLIQK